jgi:hypothetical protein
VVPIYSEGEQTCYGKYCMLTKWRRSVHNIWIEQLWVEVGWNIVQKWKLFLHNLEM